MALELQAFVGLGHTPPVLSVDHQTAFLAVLGRVPFQRWSSGSRVHQNHREAVGAWISVPHPGVSGSGGLGWGPRMCISHESFGDADATAFFKVLSP